MTDDALTLYALSIYRGEPYDEGFDDFVECVLDDLIQQELDND